jgi:hypothetical protein
MIPIIDPRRGDVEDDASSTKRRSLLSLAGSLLVEISLPKLIVAWLVLLVIPGLLLGLAPLVASAWLSAVLGKISSPLLGLWPASLLIVVVAIGWLGWRPLLRLVESSFWSLNALAVEPCYAIVREAIRHFTERLLHARIAGAQATALRGVSALAAGMLVCALALTCLALVWPWSRWLGEIADLVSLHRLAPVALANGVVLVAAYVAGAALVWGIADATMPQPRDLAAFLVHADGRPTWRIAHLSDIHVVSERYGFRIESGRAGPSGNARLQRLLAQLDRIHAREPLDAVLITGDMTDAGRSAEWAELLDALAAHPRLAERTLLLPGNHDLSIVDRANPARLDLPTSPNKRLRQLRLLSAMAAVQGDRVMVVDRVQKRLGGCLRATLAPHIGEISAFSDGGRPWRSRKLHDLWAEVFPLILPPDQDDGVGIILLNSNADTHFSFTNALGMVSTEQVRGIETAVSQFPRAYWIVALHHHVVEYPRAAKALSERIGTALINGNWFVRRLGFLEGRAIVLHGHRHIDWIGECADLTIVSAPSPVMEATDEITTYFYIHTMAVQDGRLRLLAPQRIDVEGPARDRGVGDAAH